MSRSRVAAGILFFRIIDGIPEFFLVHPGGPFYVKKDDGYWSIPKGEPDAKDTSLIITAIRETFEETGIDCADRAHIPLRSIIQKGGKKVFAWGCEHEEDIIEITSNTFTMEFPFGSGKMKEFPEVDRGGFFTFDEAKKKIKPAQIPLLEELNTIITS
jgi:predicted NUDIX family NTP pyrophosphohydrolase